MRQAAANSNHDRRRRVHAIALENALPRMHADRAAVLMDADVITRVLLKEDLRNGMSLRKSGSGVYRRNFFPNIDTLVMFPPVASPNHIRPNTIDMLCSS